jgi:Amt family ammonium transporter
MKRLFALLALVGAVGFGAPAWAEEKVAAPEAAVAQVATAGPGSS